MATATVNPTATKSAAKPRSVSPSVASPQVPEAVLEDSPPAAAPEQPKSAPKPAPVAKASIQKENEDMVRVTLFETIEPPPTVGFYEIARELNVTRLVAKETYLLPRYVAEVLVDAKKAALLS